MRKRGQLLGMPFVYIIMVLTMALVLYFGFNSLSKVNNVKEITQVSKFVLDFENQVEVVYNYDVGSAKRFNSIALPTKVTHVCFYDKAQGVSQNEIDALTLIDSELYYYMDISSKENVFFAPVGAYGAPYPDYFIENLKLKAGSTNPLCFKNTKKGVAIVLETYLEDNKVFVGVRA